MFRLPLATSAEEIHPDRFWDAVRLFHDRPHLVNRRIVGVTETNLFRIRSEHLDAYKIKEIFTKSAILYEIRRLGDDLTTSDRIGREFLESILQTYDKSIEIVRESGSVKDVAADGIYISTRFLMPRLCTRKKCVEVVIFDGERNCATFFAVSDDADNGAVLSPPFPYDVELQRGILRICVGNLEDADSASAAWLADNLFGKLMKWSADPELSGTLQPSLSLVPMEKYCNLYQTLKAKYGVEIVKVWPEKTDPLKFVYEDVAIASYLITLWQQNEADKKASFVDLGCGNGLLVHILNSEGYPGYGIDVRKRKIWDMYPSTTTLKIGTVTPSSESLYPEAEWIIGNHSDELTPWIPVIASRSSINCKFFLLPCCCYDFHGKKYQRVNSSQSQYSEYMEYVKRISEKCGFVTSIDKLRIPSTKRTCLIGERRTYEEISQYRETDAELQRFIDERSSQTTVLPSDSENKWVQNFEARPNVEKVRNCTQLDKTLSARIVRTVFEGILSAGSENVLQKADGCSWSAGGCVALPELVKVIPKEDLQKLKSECGGLQTLLRNHHQVFEVKGGSVKIRVGAKKTTNEKRKTRRCWFQENHPNGCFYSNDCCTYKHL